MSRGVGWVRSIVPQGLSVWPVRSKTAAMVEPSLLTVWQATQRLLLPPVAHGGLVPS